MDSFSLEADSPEELREKLKKFIEQFSSDLTEEIAGQTIEEIVTRKDYGLYGGEHYKQPLHYTGKMEQSVTYAYQHPRGQVAVNVDYADTLEEGDSEWVPFFFKKAEGQYDPSRLSPLGVWATQKMSWKQLDPSRDKKAGILINNQPPGKFGMLVPKRHPFLEAALDDTLDGGGIEKAIRSAASKTLK